MPRQKESRNKKDNAKKASPRLGNGRTTWDKKRRKENSEALFMIEKKEIPLIETWNLEKRAYVGKKEIVEF